MLLVMSIVIKDFIKRLHNSGEVPELLQSIETSAKETHPTCHSLCHALKVSWTILSALPFSDIVEGGCNTLTGLPGNSESNGEPSGVDNDHASSDFWAQVRDRTGDIKPLITRRELCLSQSYL